MTGTTVSQGVQCILEVKVDFFFILYAIYSTVLEILLQVISLDKLFFLFISLEIFSMRTYISQYCLLFKYLFIL